MVTVIFISSIAVIFAYLDSRSVIHHGLKLSFLVIFCFMALRYDYGNDYMGYLQGFEEINRYAYVNIFDKTLHYEPGWILLCRFFGHFNFFTMIAAISAANCIVYYRFIRKHVPKHYYWLAVFIYLFSSNIMLIQLSAIRQAFAILFFVLSLDFLVERKPLRYIICVTIGYLFHSSAIVLLPLVCFSFTRINVSFLTGSLLVLCFSLLFLFRDNIVSLLNQFIATTITRYEGYGNVENLDVGLGFLALTLFFVLIVISTHTQNDRAKVLFNLSVVGFMLLPISTALVMLSRIGFYFQPLAIAVYPLLFRNIKSKSGKAIFLSFLVLSTFYGFFSFFQSDIYGPKFETYTTIFSSK